MIYLRIIATLSLAVGGCVLLYYGAGFYGLVGVFLLSWAHNLEYHTDR